MKTTETKTMDLTDFLATHSLCRVWWASQGCPTGQELALNENADDDDEDYCDGETLASFIPEGTGHLEGTVTRDGDGEWRWDVDSLADDDVRDPWGNTLFNLVVWGDAQ